MLKTLQPLVKKSLTRRYSSGSTILYQGEVPRSACILTSGAIRVFTISTQGDEQIIAFHIAGDIFPTAWLFDKAPSALFFYEAVTDCTACLVQKDELRDFMMSSPQRIKTVIDYYATSYSASLLHINALEQPKAREKLMHTLFFLTQRYGNTTSSKVEIPLKLTHQNIASLVGLTRETTATEISKLKKQKVLTYSRQKYVVQPKKLLELMGEDSFAGIKIGG